MRLSRIYMYIYRHMHVCVSIYIHNICRVQIWVVWGVSIQVSIISHKYHCSRPSWDWSVAPSAPHRLEEKLSTFHFPWGSANVSSQICGWSSIYQGLLAYQNWLNLVALGLYIGFNTSYICLVGIWIIISFHENSVVDLTVHDGGGMGFWL